MNTAHVREDINEKNRKGSVLQIVSKHLLPSLPPPVLNKLPVHLGNSRESKILANFLNKPAKFRYAEESFAEKVSACHF